MKNIGIIIVTIIGAFIILFVLTPMLLTAIDKLDINPEKNWFKIFYICLQILIVIYFTFKGVKYFRKKQLK
jgi:membrane protein DedA with SNARE-associated domain